MKRLSVVLVTLMVLMMIPLSSHAAATCTAYRVVQRGDTLSRISREFNVSLGNLVAWNNLSNPNVIYVGQSICVQVTSTDTGGARTHTVQRGETLYRIARNYGVDLTVLARVNNISDPSRIYAGQLLRIPDVTIQ